MSIVANGPDAAASFNVISPFLLLPTKKSIVVEREPQQKRPKRANQPFFFRERAGVRRKKSPDIFSGTMSRQTGPERAHFGGESGLIREERNGVVSYYWKCMYCGWKVEGKSFQNKTFIGRQNAKKWINHGRLCKNVRCN